MENLSRFELQLELLREKQLQAQQKQENAHDERRGGGALHARPVNRLSPHHPSSHTKRRKPGHFSKKRMERFEEAMVRAISALQDMPKASSEVNTRLEALLGKVNEGPAPHTVPSPRALCFPSAAAAAAVGQTDPRAEGGGGREEREGSTGSVEARSPPYRSYPNGSPSVGSSSAKSSLSGLPTVILHPTLAMLHPPSSPSLRPTSTVLCTGILTADPLFSALRNADPHAPAVLGQLTLSKELQALQSTANGLAQDVQHAGQEAVMERELRGPRI